MIDDSSRLPAAPSQRPVEAPSGGWVTIDARAVGDAAVVLGAGRDRAEADVDPSAGIEILATEGSEVSAGETVMVAAGRDAARVEAAAALLARAIVINQVRPTPEPIVREVIVGVPA